MSKAEAMQRLYTEYERAGHTGPFTTVELAQWAITNRKWTPRPADLVKSCARDFAAALRQEYIRDSEGRKVRAKHATRTRQGVLWEDINTITRKRMELSLHQRRSQIVHDCYQLKTDAEFYNRLHGEEPPIQLVLDFRDDVAELDLAHHEDVAA